MDQEASQRDRRVIAAFDFDGTLTKEDTLFGFLRFYFPLPRLVAGFLLLSPTLMMFKLKMISNNAAKERLFRYFFEGTSLAFFNKRCDDFAGGLDRLIRPEALKKLEWHQQNGHEIVIISASPENWIKPWAQKFGISVLATQIESKDERITGKFLSKNCHGAEKVARLLEHLPDRKDYVLYAYGDSRGDRELLAFADHQFYRCF